MTRRSPHIAVASTDPYLYGNGANLEIKIPRVEAYQGVRVELEGK